MTKLSEYLQTAEATDYFGIHQNTIHKWAALGDIPMHRSPWYYRLPKRSELDKFLHLMEMPLAPPRADKPR
jgi:excisionase family DNA binding protein